MKEKPHSHKISKNVEATDVKIVYQIPVANQRGSPVPRLFQPKDSLAFDIGPNVTAA